MRKMESRLRVKKNFEHKDMEDRGDAKHHLKTIKIKNGIEKEKEVR